VNSAVQPCSPPSRRTGDTFYSANGNKTPAGDNLDLTGATIKDDGRGGVLVTMKVKSLASLQPSPTAGGLTAEWITRFTTYNAGKTPGNGHILYAGMESVVGGPPTFFAGDTRRARLFMTYEQDKSVSGSYTKAGLITLHVPAADLAEVPTARSTDQRTLYSTTAFTATTLGGLKGNPEGLFNLTDATAPFNHIVGAGTPRATGGSGSTTGSGTSNSPGQASGPGATGSAGTGSSSGSTGSTGSGVVSNASDSRTLAATGLDAAVPAAGLLVLLLAGLTYRRRRS